MIPAVGRDAFRVAFGPPTLGATLSLFEPQMVCLVSTAVGSDCAFDLFNAWDPVRAYFRFVRRLTPVVIEPIVVGEHLRSYFQSERTFCQNSLKKTRENKGFLCSLFGKNGVPWFEDHPYFGEVGDREFDGQPVVPIHHRFPTVFQGFSTTHIRLI